MMSGHCQVTAQFPVKSLRTWTRATQVKVRLLTPTTGFPKLGIPRCGLISTSSSQEELKMIQAITLPLPPSQELREQSECVLKKDAVRWVLTVPAIWKQPAKQFMREAAYLVRTCR